MKNWRKQYVAFIEYRRGTMSIYRIYFRTMARFHEWVYNAPISYDILKVEM